MNSSFKKLTKKTPSTLLKDLLPFEDNTPDELHRSIRPESNTLKRKRNEKGRQKNIKGRKLDVNYEPNTSPTHENIDQSVGQLQMSRYMSATLSLPDNDSSLEDNVNIISKRRFTRQTLKVRSLSQPETTQYKDFESAEVTAPLSNTYANINASILESSSDSICINVKKYKTRKNNINLKPLNDIHKTKVNEHLDITEGMSKTYGNLEGSFGLMEYSTDSIEVNVNKYKDMVNKRTPMKKVVLNKLIENEIESPSSVLNDDSNLQYSIYNKSLSSKKKFKGDNNSLLQSSSENFEENTQNRKSLRLKKATNTVNISILREIQNIDKTENKKVIDKSIRVDEDILNSEVNKSLINDNQSKLSESVTSLNEEIKGYKRSRLQKKKEEVHLNISSIISQFKPPTTSVEPNDNEISNIIDNDVVDDLSTSNKEATVHSEATTNDDEISNIIDNDVVDDISTSNTDVAIHSTGTADDDEKSIVIQQIMDDNTIPIMPPENFRNGFEELNSVANHSEVVNINASKLSTSNKVIDNSKLTTDENDEFLGNSEGNQDEIRLKVNSLLMIELNTSNNGVTIHSEAMSDEVFEMSSKNSRNYSSIIPIKPPNDFPNDSSTLTNVIRYKRDSIDGNKSSAKLTNSEHSTDDAELLEMLSEDVHDHSNIISNKSPDDIRNNLGEINITKSKSNQISLNSSNKKSLIDEIEDDWREHSITDQVIPEKENQLNENSPYNVVNNTKINPDWSIPSTSNIMSKKSDFSLLKAPTNPLSRQMVLNLPRKEFFERIAARQIGSFTKVNTTPRNMPSVSFPLFRNEKVISQKKSSKDSKNTINNNNLPRTFVKRIYTHYSKFKVNEKVIDAVYKHSEMFWIIFKNFIEATENGKSITVGEVRQFMIEKKFATTDSEFSAFVRRYIPEHARTFIPHPMPDGSVYPPSRWPYKQNKS